MRQPTNLHFILFLLLFLRLCWGQRSNPDEKRPSCNSCDLLLSCNCSYANFTRVPIVMDHALTLDLSFNHITMVTADDLTDHVQLRALSLHGNILSTIHQSAFDSLWSLEELDLSDNQLTALNPKWFSKLGALQQLNLLNNPYSCVGSVPVFQGLVRLRRLAFGGPALEELKTGALSGVVELEELTIHANKLARYEAGTLAYVWPLGRVTLSLRGPFLSNTSLASAVLNDVSYPETPIILEDLHLIENQSVQPFRETARRRVRHMTLRNLSISDEAIVNFLVVNDGVPLTSISFDGLTLTGEGRWEKASWTDQKSTDEFFVRNAVVLDVYKFVSFLQLGFLLQYPRKVSVINSKVFVMPCRTSSLLVNLQYLDLSDNLLTDMTLIETLCDGNSKLTDLRVLNFSGNHLKCFSTMSRLVANLNKLTHLDISRIGYSSMPPACSWPSSLRYLNISRAKLSTITSCLPTTLEVLDLSNNDLKDFTVALPALRELYLSGNRFLRLPSGHLFPNLQILNIQSNTLNAFGHSDLQSYTRLQNLQAGQNKFVCSCDFVAFLQSGIKESGDVHLTDKEESYVCNSPFYMQGELVGEVPLTLYFCHRVLLVSVTCGMALFAWVLVCVLLWRIHAFWYLKMIWAWLKAKYSSQHRCRRRIRAGTDTEALLSYDAFVSYSEKDVGWVETYLVPELEKPMENNKDLANQRSTRPLSLCLHKRDFLPGQWIVDNIISAIERSRRTIFILSENFVKSDWCRYELDFSHFCLFDGDSGEPAILILLEPLSKDDIPKRFCKLRKLMSSTTYLEWPQEEEKKEEFWRSLHNALREGEEDD